MTRDYRMYKEYPHFDMRCGCGCDPCHNTIPNFPQMPNFCPHCPPPYPPQFPQNLPHRHCNSCNDFIWLMVGISIGRMLDK